MRARGVLTEPEPAVTTTGVAADTPAEDTHTTSSLVQEVQLSTRGPTVTTPGTNPKLVPVMCTSVSGAGWGGRVEGVVAVMMGASYTHWEAEVVGTPPTSTTTSARAAEPKEAGEAHLAQSWGCTHCSMSQ